MNSKIVVSGMRPTGRLHLGHLEGVLRNWITLQESHQCFFFVADLHALTDHNEASEFRAWTFEMVRDWLALGLDPARSIIFVQSHVKEHAVLSTLLGMTSPVRWLERCPTYKDRTSELGEGSENLGLLSYPALMAADIALYDGALVPVGADQIPHLELAREIVRRFNSAFPGAELLEPQPLLTWAAKLMGTDGRKMSKSYGNAIELSASPEAISALVRNMKTDEARKLRKDPGNPDNCNLFPYQEIYSKPETEKIRRDCVTAAMGCVDCKKILLAGLEAALGAARRRRAAISDEEVVKVLEEGARRARTAAAPVMDRVLKAIGTLEAAK